MYPVIFQWDPVTITTKSFIVLTGAFLAFWYLITMIKEKKFDITFFTNNVVAIFFITLIGARLGEIIENWETYSYISEGNKSLFYLSLFLFLALAILTYVYYKKWKKYLYTKKNIFHKALLAIFFQNVHATIAVLFALLISIWYFFYPHQLSMINLWDGNFNFHIGFVSFIGVIYFLCKKQKSSFTKAMDTIVFPFLILFAFNSLGNFFSGANYGIPPESDLWPAVVYNSPMVKYTVPIHPTQLHTVVFIILLFVAGKIFSQKKRIDGMIALFIFLIYFIGEIFLEFLRGDQAKLIWQDYRITQVYDLLITIAIIVILVLHTHKKGRWRKIQL